MSLSKNTNEKVFLSSFCRALHSRLEKNIHFLHGDATRYFDHTPFYIEISSQVNYTAIIVHMGVPSPNVRRRCEQVTEEKGINPGKLSYYYTQSRPFVRRHGISTKQPAVIIFHVTREIVRIIIWYIISIQYARTIRYSPIMYRYLYVIIPSNFYTF